MPTVPVTAPDTAADDALGWRSEVAAVRRVPRARVFPMRVAVGLPAGEQAGCEVPWPVPPLYDPGLCYDVVGALLEGWVGPPSAAYAWLARPGTLEPHDLDATWHGAGRRAFASHDRALLGFRVVTRTGWRDLETGERGFCTRLRV